MIREGERDRERERERERGGGGGREERLVTCCKEKMNIWRCPYHNFSCVVYTVGCGLVRGLYVHVGHITCTIATCAYSTLVPRDEPLAMLCQLAAPSPFSSPRFYHSLPPSFSLSLTHTHTHTHTHTRAFFSLPGPSFVHSLC